MIDLQSAKWRSLGKTDQGSLAIVVYWIGMNKKKKKRDNSGGLAAVPNGFSHTTDRGRGFDTLSAGWY